MYTDFIKKIRKTASEISPLLEVSDTSFDMTELLISQGIFLSGDRVKGPLFTITYDTKNGICSIGKRMELKEYSSKDPDEICKYLIERFDVEEIKHMMAEINALSEDDEI